MKNYVGFKAYGMGFNAHLTLIYTGEMEPETESIVQEIVYEASYRSYIVNRSEFGLLGRDLSTPIIKVIPTIELWELRNRLIRRGVPNPSEYEWNPHITLKMDHANTIRVPYFITLGELDLY